MASGASFTAESWVWWSLVIAVAASRFVSRRIALGSWKKLQIDDYLMLLALGFYTTETVTIRIVYHTSSNLLPPGYDVNDLTQGDRKEREYGSKLILVVEQCQCAVIWLAKACLITLYLRITTVWRENVAIKILAVYIAVGYVVMEILYFGVWCRPFHNYWAVPTPNIQCSAATDHLITNAVFNLSSDVAMLAIALPMFLRLTMAWRKKITVIGVFSLGIFVVIAAVLNKWYSFTQPYGSQWTYWYVRECSTALIVANLPFVWTLWRRVMYARRYMNGRGDSITVHSVAGRRKPDIETGSKKNGLDASKDRRNSSEDELDDLQLAVASLGGARSPSLPGNMTFAEMLRAGEPGAQIGDEGVSPLTHPHLFYGRGRGHAVTAAARMASSRIEQACLKDSNERETVRRGSSSGTKKNTETPTSSVFTSASLDQKSLGSIL